MFLPESFVEGGYGGIWRARDAGAFTEHTQETVEGSVHSVNATRSATSPQQRFGIGNRSSHYVASHRRYGSRNSAYSLEPPNH